MVKRRITKSEINFIVVGATIAIILYFIVEPFKEILKQHFPSPTQQIIVGVILLLLGAYMWDLKKKK